MGRDLRHAVRRLLQAPGFATAAVLTLALGIGASTAVFSVVHAVVISPLPYPESDRLMSLWHAAPGADIPRLGFSIYAKDRMSGFGGFSDRGTVTDFAKFPKYAAFMARRAGVDRSHETSSWGRSSSRKWRGRVRICVSTYPWSARTRSTRWLARVRPRSDSRREGCCSSSGTSFCEERTRAGLR